jgi:hypothetical protein
MSRYAFNFQIIVLVFTRKRVKKKHRNPLLPRKEKFSTGRLFFYALENDM